MNWIDEVNFNEEGLVPVIVQDVKTSRVLMLGWANREALESTVATGVAASTSRAPEDRSGARASRPAIIRSWWACSSPRTASPSSTAWTRRAASRAIRDMRAATGANSCRAAGASASLVVRAPEDMYEK